MKPTAHRSVNRGLLISFRKIFRGRNDHMMLTPPFIVDAPTLDTIVDRLGAAVAAS
jgi:adenosylmethionine-8-amino-7-oxononanoate aminotransferase